ncbi:Uncharacterised protein [Mycobacteroides abscessus subsp. massiliense]|nr:Uncharacterised protein [Mycobacteroides abscessus subsp. massiliense]SKU75963.1 Uncharacterised protein [Mycobacteroides abscessus subsp. massiliense]
MIVRAVQLPTIQAVMGMHPSDGSIFTLNWLGGGAASAVG